jgi:hypothetical protein
VSGTVDDNEQAPGLLRTMSKPAFEADSTFFFKVRTGQKWFSSVQSKLNQISAPVGLLRIKNAYTSFLKSLLKSVTKPTSFVYCERP